MYLMYIYRISLKVNSSTELFEWMLLLNPEVPVPTISQPIVPSSTVSTLICARPESQAQTVHTHVSNNNTTPHILNPIILENNGRNENTDRAEPPLPPPLPLPLSPVISLDNIVITDEMMNRLSESGLSMIIPPPVIVKASPPEERIAAVAVCTLEGNVDIVVDHDHELSQQEPLHEGTVQETLHDGTVQETLHGETVQETLHEGTVVEVFEPGCEQPELMGGLLDPTRWIPRSLS